MNNIITIISVTKDDFEGAFSTVTSTQGLREKPGVTQIIVDSSDKALAEKLEHKLSGYENLQYVWMPPVGIAKAFNKGLELADSEWIWFLNGKDELHPNLNIETFIDVIKSSNADALIFELEFMQSGERYKHPYLWAIWPPTNFWIPHPATLVRSGLFEKFGGFREDYKLAMDGELWFRIFSQDVVVDLLSIAIARYDQGGLSQSMASLSATESKKIIFDNLPMLVRKWFANGFSVLKVLREFSRRSRG